MQDISPPSPAPISAASPSAVQDLIKKIQELYSLVTVPAQKWEENLPHMHELVTWIQHSLALTDSENAPLNEIQTLQTEIADIQNTIAKFTEPAIREKASSILQHITTMSGQLFIGPEHNGKTAYMKASYKPLNLVALLNEIRPFLLEILNQALRNNATQWSEVQDVLKLNNQSKGCLLNTINKIKSERLEYGHASLSTSKNLVLSTNLIPLAQEHFSLIRTEVNMLQTLLAWVLPLLPPSATLEDLKQEAWTFSL
ncbi:hypothetical protein PSTG_01332 [Puccinia striiformis f. sp. tritici PST-78]|uniref:Uncharacterized protein n=1 Tax=Puccinia striiformis f. sp. tritici PST-78 TaxID=1165861 RepID=A0A0L0W2P5_9BASI|nr:hypothetical protein PSTG_01332 [Puccinia striiformis f. sp. tritici PST-78]